MLGAILAAMVIFFPRGLAGIAGDAAGLLDPAQAAAGAGVTPLVETKGVSKHYGEFRALEDVSVAVSEGEFVSVVGPNGAGKTTLVNLLTGLLVPTRGQVFFKGANIAGVGPGRARQARHGAHVPARADLPAAHRRRDHRRRRRLAAGQAVAPVLGAVATMPRCGARATRSPASSGWRTGWTAPRACSRRARRSCSTWPPPSRCNPEVILLDEPTSGVSTAEKHGLMKTLIGAAKTAGVKAIILVEHDMDLVAAYSQRIIALSEGKVLADLPPGPFFSDPVIIETVVGKRRGH